MINNQHLVVKVNSTNHASVLRIPTKIKADLFVSLQEAMRAAQEMETKLEQEEEVCNETMKALWEECKPCLKNTCVKYYSRTCSSGSGLVGRQVRTSRVHFTA